MEPVNQGKAGVEEAGKKGPGLVGKELKKARGKD